MSGRSPFGANAAQSRRHLPQGRRHHAPHSLGRAPPWLVAPSDTGRCQFMRPRGPGAGPLVRFGSGCTVRVAAVRFITATTRASRGDPPRFVCHHFGSYLRRVFHAGSQPGESPVTRFTIGEYDQTRSSESSNVHKEFIRRTAMDSSAVPAVANGVVTQSSEEVDLPERGPVRLGEPELRMRRLPQQKTGQSLFPGSANDQIRVRLSRGVQVFGDVVDIEGFGGLLDGGAVFGVRLQQLAPGVGDLRATAGPDGHIDDHAVAAAGALRGGGEPRRDVRGEHVQRTHDRQPPRIARFGEFVHDVRNDLQERGDLLAGAVAHVVRRQQPQRDDLDLRLPAPAEEVRDLAGAHPVTTVDVGEPRFTRPATVAVEDDADVARVSSRGLLLEPPRIDRVDHVGEERPKTHITAAYAWRQSELRLLPDWGLCEITYDSVACFSVSVATHKQNEATPSDVVDTRPRLRGHIHFWSFFGAVAAGATLIALAASTVSGLAA